MARDWAGAIDETARSCIAGGWTSERLREEDCGDPLITEEVADRMAEIEREEQGRG